MCLRILALNPGSTSTKLALSEEGRIVESYEIVHDTGELMAFSSVMEQEDFRLSCIREEIGRLFSGTVKTWDAVIGRGGLLKPSEGGVYRVSPPMLEDLKSAAYGEHASNLGAVLAERLAEEQRAGGKPCQSLIADPVVVDELCDEARISGMPELERRSIFHALSQKSVGRAVSAALGKPYEQLNLIIAHMGGGVSVGAHCRGRVIDVNNALDGDGPFSPERSGSVPVGQWLELALSGRFSKDELKKKISGRGGMYAYTATKDLRELLKKVEEGEEHAGLVYKAMVLQISQEISGHGATLKGLVHGIGLTGGLARSDRLVEDLKQRISFLAPVFVYPGEREMEALTENALAALKGEREIREYVR